MIPIGNPGRGKTHLAITLGLNARYAGFHVLFKNAATLSTELIDRLTFRFHVVDMSGESFRLKATKGKA